MKVAYTPEHVYPTQASPRQQIPHLRTRAYSGVSTSRRVERMHADTSRATKPFLTDTSTVSHNLAISSSCSVSVQTVSLLH